MPIVYVHHGVDFSLDDKSKMNKLLCESIVDTLNKFTKDKKNTKNDVKIKYFKMEPGDDFGSIDIHFDIRAGYRVEREADKESIKKLIFYAVAPVLKDYGIIPKNAVYYTVAQWVTLNFGAYIEQEFS